MGNIIFAIDPGPRQSAFIKWDSRNELITGYGIVENNELMHLVRKVSSVETIVCEMIQGFGMPVGKEVFETVLLVGQIKEASLQIGHSLNLVYRKDIKMHFCQTVRAKDTNIRQALKDRFGDPGTKKNQGKLYGVKKDIWAALACAIFWMDTHLPIEGGRS